MVTSHILMKVFREYMKSYENDVEILADKMIRSQDLAHLAEFKVNIIIKKRMKRMKKQQPPFKVFNG